MSREEEEEREEDERKTKKRKGARRRTRRTARSTDVEGQRARQELSDTKQSSKQKKWEEKPTGQDRAKLDHVTRAVTQTRRAGRRAGGKDVKTINTTSRWLTPSAGATPQLESSP